MPITEEQRQRAEANRLAALAKRKALAESSINHHQQGDKQNPWRLFKCRKLSSEQPTSSTHFPTPVPVAPLRPDSTTHLSEKFRVRLEISSSDSFSVTPEPIKGFAYPGEESCTRTLNDCLSTLMPSHYTQNYGGGTARVYKLRDYDAVLTCLKNYKGIEIEKIPFGTLNVVQRLSHSFESGHWEPCRPEHLTDEKVEELIQNLPRKLLDTLLPFQFDGLRFGLRRGGRCLIADEMGLGKTLQEPDWLYDSFCMLGSLQAIAIAGCFMTEGPILVVCPAILRYSWAEELEKWLPSCLPSEIHLVFGRQHNPAYLTKFPRVVVISYTMLHHLGKSMLEREWGVMIIDESHHMRCSKKKSEPQEIKAVLEVAANIKHIVLLSGTPSLSRPGLLGQNKYDFAKTYCNVKFIQTSKGGFQDFSRGVRLVELNLLLKQTVMIRRLKEHVLGQLPPKRRQIIRLSLKRTDIVSAKVAAGVMRVDSPEGNPSEAVDSEKSNGPDDDDCCRSRQLSYQELGVAKLPGFCDWLSFHPLILESDNATEMDVNHSSQKMIIFAHHHKVLDGVQEFICEKGVGFIRIDGTTLPRDRQSAVLSFQSSEKVKIAIIGITAGGVGLNFSSAQSVVFLELPLTSSLMLQAEDRAHRRGQTNAVNIYIFCGKDTMDERLWQNLNKQLHRVSSTTNGKYDAVPEIAVDDVSCFETYRMTERRYGQCSEMVVCAESVLEDTKLPDMGLVQDARSCDKNDGTGDRFENCLDNNGDTVQMDVLHVKDNKIHDMEADGDLIASENLEGNSPKPEGVTCGEVLSSKLDKINEGKAQLEKEVMFQTTEVGQCGTFHNIEVDRYQCTQVNSLRFEVSRYTGRIHLYSCIPGMDSRPQPLFENFRPEELELVDPPASNENEERFSGSFKDFLANQLALIQFIKEWNQLRPIERRKLIGKTLQLPLAVELCCLNENINHNSGGLLKGGSKRRVTPLCDITHPLPSNAVWKSVYLSNSHGKKEKQYTQGWTADDQPLCKLCQKPCKGNNAKTPEYFEDLFCDLSCYEEYRIRTSARYLRHELFQIEHGICRNCHLDCHQLVKVIRPLSLESRKAYVQKVAPNLASRKKLLDKLVNDPSEGNAWHADHIVPVYRGGGECRLENMRTLCVACHYDVTAAQRAERRLARAEAKKQLKLIMKDMSNQRLVEETGNNSKGLDDLEEESIDDHLLVKVPGSAYSKTEDTNPGSIKDVKDDRSTEDSCHDSKKDGTSQQ